MHQCNFLTLFPSQKSFGVGKLSLDMNNESLCGGRVEQKCLAKASKMSPISVFTLISFTDFGISWNLSLAHNYWKGQKVVLEHHNWLSAWQGAGLMLVLIYLAFIRWDSSYFGSTFLFGDTRCDDFLLEKIWKISREDLCVVTLLCCLPKISIWLCVKVDITGDHLDGTIITFFCYCYTTYNSDVWVHWHISCNPCMDPPTQNSLDPPLLCRLPTYPLARMQSSTLSAHTAVILLAV